VPTSLWRSLDDRRLVLASLLGELEAYDELVRRYRGAVFVVTFRLLGDRALAEDATQEALLVAFKALPQLADPARFSAWLHAIARRHARKVAERGRKRRGQIDELLLREVPSLRERPDPAQRWVEAVEVRQALEALPEVSRLAVELMYFEGMSVRDIASFLGVTETTVTWRLHRAYELLRRE